MWHLGHTYRIQTIQPYGFWQRSKKSVTEPCLHQRNFTIFYNTKIVYHTKILALANYYYDDYYDYDDQEPTPASHDAAIIMVVLLGGSERKTKTRERKERWWYVHMYCYMYYV